ncbi:hypothetical protein AB205_0110180, partial [Aquarana catesbeiana]
MLQNDKLSATSLAGNVISEDTVTSAIITYFHVFFLYGDGFLYSENLHEELKCSYQILNTLQML